MDNLYTPNCIRTFSGNYINPLQPDKALIKIEDIAHGLSMQCRFGGHTKVFYSVAEHCVYVSSLCPGNEIEALLHDASEAYILDIPKPIKNNLVGYKEAEDTLMIAIASKYGFKYPLSEDVKDADKYALEREWEHVVLNVPEFTPMSPSEAKSKFLETFHKYYANSIRTGLSGRYVDLGVMEKLSAA